MPSRRRKNLRQNNAQPVSSLSESPIIRSIGVFCVFIVIWNVGSGFSGIIFETTANSSANASAVAPIYASVQDLPDDVLNQLDVIMVLGGGRPASYLEPPLYVQNRCQAAFDVVLRAYSNSMSKPGYSRNFKVNPGIQAEPIQDTILPILTLSAGTAHVPQLISENDGLPVWESTASAAYIQDVIWKSHKEQQQQQSERNSSNAVVEPFLEFLNIYVETTSYDTIGNAYYARTIHTDPNQVWKNILVITSEFHMERSRIIFDWIFGIDGNDDDARFRTSKQSSATGRRYKVWYLSTPNVGLTAIGLEARIKKEQSSIQALRSHIMTYYKTLPEVWKWLHTRHDLYSATPLISRAGDTTTTSTVDKESYGGR